MLYSLLSAKLNDKFIVLIAAAVAFVATYMLLVKPFGFLPRDSGKYVIDKDGKRVEVNKNSKGKVTGTGFVLVIVWLLSIILFIPINLKAELGFVILLVLSFLMMITGFLDDISKAPWGELVKGILDLILAVAASITFVKYYGTAVYFIGHQFVIPKVVYIILGTALIWGSINVTNCSDGVDGLCGTVSVIEFFAFSMIFGNTLAKYSATGMIMAFTPIKQRRPICVVVLSILHISCANTIAPAAK